MTASSPAGGGPKSSLWYGWVILGVVFFVMAIMISTRNSLGFFFKTMSGEFGWSRAQTAGAYSIGMLAQSACSLLFGWLADRWRLRWMMSLGVFFGGAAFLIGSSIESLWQFYLMYALLNVGFAASTFVPQVQIISNWFVKRRGFAMGVSNSAQGFAAVLNLAVPLLIGLIGWRYSYTALAGFALIAAFPLAAILLRDHPSEKNTVADAPFLSAAESAAFMKKSKTVADRPVEAFFAKGLASLRFALIGATYGAIAFVFVGIVVHLIPHATDQGFSPEGSAVIFLIWGLCVMGANLASGVSDQIGRAPTYVLGAGLGVAACVLLAIFLEGMPPGLFYLGAGLSGLALGLTRPTASALLADHFAGPGFGKMNGMVMLVFAFFGAAGSYITGFLFDVTGSYRSAFLLMAAVFLLGIAFAVPLGRMKRNGPETD